VTAACESDRMISKDRQKTGVYSCLERRSRIEKMMKVCKVACAAILMIAWSTIYAMYHSGALSDTNQDGLFYSRILYRSSEIA